MSESTKIEGIAVVLTGRECWLSYLVYCGQLDEALQTERLYQRNGSSIYYTISPHTLLLITQWARARGYTKARHVITEKKDKPRHRIR